MKKRKTQPKNNKHYIRQVSGGYNGAVQGYPVISGANVLCNCVGYANGRFNEIINDPNLEGAEKKFKYQLVCNAENFIEAAKKQGLKISKTPVLGGIMVWQKGATLGSGDGAGHVAVVETVYSDGSILTSESGWGGWAFKTVKRTNSNGRWGQASGYTFRGCIINPSVTNKVTKKKAYKITKPYTSKLPTKTVKYGTKGVEVKRVQRFLNWCLGTKLDIDGDYGTKTQAACKKFQKKYDLEQTGNFNKACRKKAKAIVEEYAAKAIQNEIIEACKAQAEYMKNFTYKWQSNPTIEKSKKYGTCVTFAACVLQRVGLVKSGKYIWDDGKGYGTGKVYGDTSKMTVTYMGNKTFEAVHKKELKTGEQLLVKGDTVICDDNKSGVEGSGGHIMIFSGKWTKAGNPRVYDQNSATYAKKGKKSLLRTYSKKRKILAICRAK